MFYDEALQQAGSATTRALGALQTATEITFAFRFARQPVDVPAEPGLSIPMIAFLAIADLDLGEIEHDL